MELGVWGALPPTLQPVSQCWLLPRQCDAGSSHPHGPSPQGLRTVAFLMALATRVLMTWTLCPARALCSSGPVTVVGGLSVLMGKVWLPFPSPKLGSGVSPSHPPRTWCWGRASGFFLHKIGHSVSMCLGAVSAFPTGGRGGTRKGRQNGSASGKGQGDRES